MLNLNCVMINSDQAEELAKYYGEVLQTEPAMKDDKNGFTGYMAGQAFLMIGPHDKVSGKNANPERTIFFLEAQDVVSEFVRIKGIEGTKVIAEPYSPGEDPNGKLATLADPDGNFFQLASPWKM